MNRALHLDVTGGIAGDMFLAAMLSAFPEAESRLQADLQAAGLTDHVQVSSEDVREKGFAAQRVTVDILAEEASARTWRSIRADIEACGLAAPVKSRAVAIFQDLADAEARCHGIPVDQVHFHELADWDSIADIISAASLIEYVGADSWTVSLLPLGSGTVKTQHGRVPVPAPATAELLKGFSFIDDGGRGERITPTGAAILKHLSPSQSPLGPRGKLTATGLGAGTMQIEGIPNILRVLCFETDLHHAEMVSLIRFDVDDMTPEELAVSLDRLRADEAVLDASHLTAIGKKGRTQFAVSVMVRRAACDRVTELCFAETSTIGLRVETVARHVLPRQAGIKHDTRFKSVTRPQGTTAKAESDDLAGLSGLSARRAKARDIEALDD
ncbi:MAG: LarC family nickel insertion protein [Pseudomonadota bacterium]